VCVCMFVRARVRVCVCARVRVCACAFVQWLLHLRTRASTCD